MNKHPRKKRKAIDELIPITKKVVQRVKKKLLLNKNEVLNKKESARQFSYLKIEEPRTMKEVMDL